MTTEELYKKLEKDYKTSISPYSYFSQYTIDNPILNEIIKIERSLLGKVSLSIYPSDRKDLISYCKDRVGTTMNCHLIAKYNHVLLLLTKNNQYALPTLEAYMKILDYYCANNENVDYRDTLELVIALFQKYQKKDIAKIKDYIMSILFKTSIVPELKSFVLNLILNTKKLFTPNELRGIPSLCIELYRQESDRNVQERLLESALAFSKKVRDAENMAISSELLGDLKWDEIMPDDDKNIAISHLNESVYTKIISLYKIAKNKDKLSRTMKAYEDNKKRHKYLKLPIKIPISNLNRAYDIINDLIEQKIEETSLSIITSLCFQNTDILLPRYKQIEKEPKDSINTFFDTINIDVWGNKFIASDNMNIMHQSFHLTYTSYSFHYIILVIYNAMKKDKLNKAELKEVLETAGFALPLIYKRNDKRFETTIYSVLDKGLEEFLIQCRNYIDEKEADWRFCIDFLSPKFESLIRIFAKELGISIEEVYDNNTSQLKTLEKILQDEKFKEVFNEDDLFLFRHTFIKEGLNIRNNVAHGLLMPTDYTADKATLVFLSILRLSKVTLYFLKQKLYEQGIDI